jgi:biotin synthase
MESPDYVRMSTAAAMTLGYYPGKFNRGERLDALNLLTVYDEGCRARCAYCGLSSSRDPEEDSFIRVSWPVLSLEETIQRTKENAKHLQRVCVSMITHPRSYEDMLTIMKAFNEQTGLLISGLIAPSLIRDSDGIRKIKDAGADMLGVAIDAVRPDIFDKLRGSGRPDIFDKLRGSGVHGPHKWDHYWNVIEWCVDVFGRGMVGVHLIVGLGETEKEMIDVIQRAEDMGVKTHLFSFFPEEGSEMESWGQPPYGHYRRVQLARYLINEELARADGFAFNEKGQLTSYGDKEGLDLDAVIDKGDAFMTSGCAGHNGRVACNRPYGNERPSKPIRNYAFVPEADDIKIIREQLWNYSD